MTPVHQTVFGDEVGNCLQAAIASLFDLPLDAVPHFIASGDGWWAALQAWLHQRGLHCVFTPAYVDQPGYYLMVGKSPRGAYQHVVVAKDGECIHDPHPDGTGLLERSGEYIMAWVFEEAG